MPMTDKGACEWFVWDLRRSNLIDRGQIDQIVSEFFKKQPGAEPAALAQYLVEQGVLSQFQASRLLEGKTQGLVLGPYTLVDALGTGSMGTVYKAQCKTDSRWYAVKVLPRRSMWNVRIARRLVRSFEQCKHPSIVPFADVGTAGGLHYLAWPLVEGETLERIVEREKKLPVSLAARYGLQTAEGLDLCHQNDMVHGLLKPSNLMVGPDQQVRILDLGIGSLLAEGEGESLVDTMSTANTLTSGLDCCSPESIMEPSNRTPAGDQYSLGCVLYFLLAGRYPFPDGAAVEKMMAHQTKQPTPLRQVSPEVPEELAAVVDRLMQKSPEARFHSMADVVRALVPLGTLPPPIIRPSGRSAQGLASRSAQGVAARPTNGAAKPAAPAPSLHATPPPPAPAPIVLPSRASVHGTAPAAPAAAPARPPQPAPPPPLEVSKAPSLVQRIGTFGLIVSALLIGVLIWAIWLAVHK